MDLQRTENKPDVLTYEHWKKQIEAAQAWRENFCKAGNSIIKRYRDEDNVTGGRRFNVLYANTETLAPVVYSQPPKPDVEALNLQDIASRKGAAMIESALSYYSRNKGLDRAAQKAVQDFLLPGYGVVRPRYNSVIGEDVIEGETVERVLLEEIEFDYIAWENLLFPECSSWQELPWIAFKSYYTQEEAEKEFGKEKAELLNYLPYGVEDEQYQDRKQRGAKAEKACVFEIWDKQKRQQIFWAESHQNKPLEINDDPLELDDFFPTPKPLCAVETNNTLLPTPFYKQYEDQAQELDNLNARIFSIISYMKRRGFYDESFTELANIANMGDNQFFPVSNWSEFQQRGGLVGAMQVEDITSYANILQVLLEARQQVLDDIYQIIGISDIRRAQTDPRETLGAQKLKSRYGTLRISTYQRKVADYLRDVLEIAGEIIIKQFDAETLSIITGMPLETKMREILDGEGQPTGQQEVEHVGTQDLIEDLRSKEPVSVKVNIQSESTVLEDIEGDRSSMREAIEALAEYTQVAPGLTQSIGISATGKILEGIVEKYKLGRDIQQDVMDHVSNIVANGLPEDGPSPEEVIAQSELQRAQINAQVEMQKAQMQAATKAAELQLKAQELELKAAELGVDRDFKREKINLEALDKMIKMEALEVEAQSPENTVVGV